MDQCCFARWYLLSVGVVCNAAGGWAWRVGSQPPLGLALEQSGGRHCIAGQYGYVLLRRHLVYILVIAHCLCFLA